MIRIRLTAKDLQSLVHAYMVFAPIFPRNNEHNTLLYECMVAMYYRLVRILKKGKGSATITFSGIEALAFYQYWMCVDTAEMPLSTVVILKVITKIDSKHVHVKSVLLTPNEYFLTT